ncbi:MAG: SPASM domain-containing protein [Henriciella sp.]|nr:SPASM domain-containing protein [Henriciella sp.]MBO6695164.1 SPASM domain-containing protein [Henriciella sp.]
MQAIYWVLTWACHRKCNHCYDDRFRPYVRDALTEVVAEGQTAYQAVIDNLPDNMSWLNENTGQRERTLLVLAGGELLIDGVREELFYPALDAIQARWGDNAPKISIQTTGDVLTPQILDECLSRGVESIAIASIDDHHVGMQGEKKFKFMDDIRTLMSSRGVREVSLGGEKSARLKAPDLSRQPKPGEPTFLFFGAQADLWIGELWPRGRAWTNGLSNAGYDVNFCARWSGAKNFLKIGEAGSEVAIEPDGSIYPCCLKTKAPLGSLTEERLEDILASVAALPAIQALNQGDPERMGEHDGIARADFQKLSIAKDGKDREVANLCLGCDRYFEATLGKQLTALREERLKARV